MNKYNHWIAKLVGKLNGQKRFAITLGQTAYYSVSKEEVFTNPKWVRHEDVHKKQWASEGRLRFLFKYLYYSVRYGYKNNPYEVEARACSGD